MHPLLFVGQSHVDSVKYASITFRWKMSQYVPSVVNNARNQPALYCFIDLFTGRPTGCTRLLIGRQRGTCVRRARSVKSSSTMAECVRLDRSASGHTMDKSITLPPDEIFRNLENAKRFAIDIGTC